MIEFVVIVIALFLIALWFLKGIFRDSQKQMEKANEEYAKQKHRFREADRMLDDPDFKQRLFGKDNPE